MENTGVRRMREPEERTGGQVGRWQGREASCEYLRWPCDAGAAMGSLEGHGCWGGGPSSVTD
jgi:hypothetical protein